MSCIFIKALTFPQLKIVQLKLGTNASCTNLRSKHCKTLMTISVSFGSHGQPRVLEKSFLWERSGLLGRQIGESLQNSRFSWGH